MNIGIFKKSPVKIMASLFGIGTGLPVILFTFLLALGTQYVEKIFSKLAQCEKWARRLTGAIFILVGLFYTLIYIFGISLQEVVYRDGQIKKDASI